MFTRMFAAVYGVALAAVSWWFALHVCGLTLDAESIGSVLAVASCVLAVVLFRQETDRHRLTLILTLLICSVVLIKTVSGATFMLIPLVAFSLLAVDWTLECKTGAWFQPIWRVLVAWFWRVRANYHVRQARKDRRRSEHAMPPYGVNDTNVNLGLRLLKFDD
jgi:hypothetical protein